MRGRRTIDDIFEICFSLVRVLQKPIIGDVENVIPMTKAVVSLHNHFIHETRYISGLVEEDMGGDQNLKESFLLFNHSEKLAQIFQLELQNR